MSLNCFSIHSNEIKLSKLKGSQFSSEEKKTSVTEITKTNATTKTIKIITVNKRT